MKSGSNPEAYYLSRCKKMVEEKLGWGSSDTWTHADCLEISERISEQTRNNLSVTTIKRLWGKVNYEGSPSLNTLNVLAIYLGYDNWKSFKLAQTTADAPKPFKEVQQPIVPAPHEPLIVRKKPAAASIKRLLVPILLALLVFAITILFYSAKEKNTLAPVASGRIVFNSEPLAKGIPNTVVFNYDLTDLDFDSAFIQQNWDPGRRERISRENKQHTSVYYFPGHFNAKLIIDNQIVKEHGLLVATEGWLGLVERESYPYPVYLQADKIIANGVLHASAEVLANGKIDEGKDLGTTYVNARDFGVSGDNFTLEAAVKNNLAEGGQLCQEVMIFIDGEKGVMWVPLSAPGCVGNLSLNFGEVHVSGKTRDLSAFGADLSKWNKVRCVVENKRVKLYLNDALIYTTAYRESIGKIMGLNFKFHGAGAVDNVRLLDARQQVIYADAFDEP